MGEIRFASIATRAFKESAEFVRWPKVSAVVTAIVVVLGSGIATQLTTGNVPITIASSLISIACLFLLVFLFKLVAVPIAMANETASAREIAEAELSTRIDALNREVAELTRPKPEAPRNPDGIYQHGEIVGNTVGARRLPNTSWYHFDQINADGNFDPDSEFEYREWALILEGKAPVMSGRNERGAFYQTQMARAQIKGKR